MGPSVDRRSFAHVAEVYNDTSIYSLICAACAQIKVHTPCATPDIEFHRAYIHSLDDEVRRNNFCFKTFQARYAAGKPLNGAEGLQNKCWLWKRKLVWKNGKQETILCCPEDILCDMDHSDDMICEDCAVPLCHECRMHLYKTRTPKIPMALANDNWYDFSMCLIYRWKVR